VVKGRNVEMEKFVDEEKIVDEVTRITRLYGQDEVQIQLHREDQVVDLNLVVPTFHF
jgi:hypothetical protein